MRKRDKAKKIRTILNDLYPNPSIPLKHQDSYTLLLAVLLSAQCTDARVNAITPKLFSQADNPQAMIQLGTTNIEKIIRPCGLAPRKSLAIYNLSLQLLEEHSGRVPEDFASLESLPGVGHKTASVVMSQAFGHPAFPIDTHIHRCARRWQLTKGNTVTQTEADLKKIFAKKYWNKLHLQIIYFGREYCKARGHIAQQCPICSWAASSGA